MSKTRIPWTRDELNALIPEIDKSLDELEAGQDGEVKPLGPMSVPECMEFFKRLLDLAGERALTQSECFIFGQFLSCYRQAVQAEMLGKKGRYFVLSEADINGLMASHQNAKD